MRGESTLRYLAQAVGLVSQNFLAGAAGLAVGFAFIRGFARERSETIGNFWVDLVRALLWVLLPLSLIGAPVLVWRGVPPNFAPYVQVRTVEGGTQIIAQGPVAALEFTKNLGPMAAGSSTSTARIRTRIRRRLSISWRCLRSPCCLRLCQSPSVICAAGLAPAGRSSQ